MRRQSGSSTIESNSSEEYSRYSNSCTIESNPCEGGDPCQSGSCANKSEYCKSGDTSAKEINVASTVNTTVSNNVQSNITNSVNNNVATSVNIANANHQTVNTTTSKNANSANVNSKQQQGTLSVTSTSPGSQIQIRANQGNTGDSSLQLKITGPEPLYVVDGVTTTKNFVNSLDPNNISSMEVLKGTEATKQYGESGKNGVIKITTK